MEYTIFKRSAIHNLKIDEACDIHAETSLREGLVIPLDILEKADIMPWEQVIVTSIGGDSWRNRIKTFVIPTKEGGKICAIGSLKSFLNKNDVTCLITRTLLDGEGVNNYNNGCYYTFDLGFDPVTLTNKSDKAGLDIEYFDHKERGVLDYKDYTEKRLGVRRFFLNSLVQGLVVNSTHPDCLQGSAELPGEVMEKAGILKYQSVTVYNSTKGGAADTYAVPMPAGVVMTTGAMATFAKIGEGVNVATYCFSDSVKKSPTLVLTDGKFLVL